MLLDWSSAAKVFEFLQDHSLSTALLVGVIVFMVLRSWWDIKGYSSKLPPGPRGLPFVGYLPFLGKLQHVTFWKLSKIYGPVVRVRVGAQNMITLNDFDSIKEALTKSELLNRPPTVLDHIGMSGIVTLNGEAWLDNRRYCLHVLRDLGFGKKSMEHHMKEEIQYLIEKLSASTGSPVLISQYLVPSMSNNITALVFGSRYPYGDRRRQFLDDSLRKVAKFVSTSSVLNFLPPMLNKLVLLPFTRWAPLIKAVTDMKDFVRREVEAHRETLDNYSNRDFIDGYLKKMHENEGDPASNFTMSRLVGNVINFFGAGSNTVQLSIQWHLLNCAHRFYEVQAKIQKEIEEVIGNERAPTWEDRNHMHFTMAAIWEMYRYRTIAPMGFPRCVSKDTFVHDYFLPAGAVVMPNLWAVHMNKEVWVNPEDFIPERFLRNNCTELADRPEQLISFSLGKRMCPGETLATMEIFLYLTSILQKFTVLPEQGKTIDMTEQSHTVTAPLPQNLRFVAR
ncbi:cytochrome P450 2F3-like [Ornithodoros turicata]|uniref:cytochrome P450 2F3-like n=1 Tax=Ornithodoros turicata TaxID=34597 RepID=UPI003139BEA6